MIINNNYWYCCYYYWFVIFIIVFSTIVAIIIVIVITIFVIIIAIIIIVNIIFVIFSSATIFWLSYYYYYACYFYDNISIYYLYINYTERRVAGVEITNSLHMFIVFANILHDLTPYSFPAVYAQNISIGNAASIGWPHTFKKKQTNVVQ